MMNELREIFRQILESAQMVLLLGLSYHADNVLKL